MTKTRINETAEVELKKYRGDSLTLPFAVTAGGSPVDITEATIRFLVGTIDEETVGVDVTNGGALGTGIIFIPDTVMDDLAIGNHDLAVELYWADDDIRKTLFTGTLILVDDLHE
jgi:hypothetical protein